MDDLVIGIDLGTTNSCVSIFMNGKTKILENSDGGRITPSFIFFTTLQETLVGENGKRMASGKPDHGIYEVKRLIGRKFDDSLIKNNLKYLPFKVEADGSNTPLVVIEQRNRTIRKSPQQLCTIILQKLRKDVEAKLGQTVTKLVVTVPAYFNVTQREVTLAAAQDAGFSVLKLLNEPTAAAMSYYFENVSTPTNYSLVYDLGGGTFDVAILKKNANNIKIIAVNGDTQLGGHDFDNIIVDYVCQYLIRDYGYDPKSDKNNLRRLHNKCEDAKKALSSVQETLITLIGFVNNHPQVLIPFTKEQFENLAEALFERTIDIVDSCVKSSGISKKTIDEVILSGGSTRIPKIQEMISRYFDGKCLNKFVNPDECVAEGAALQAAMLSKNSKQFVHNMKIEDVIPLTLGTGISANRMSFIINKNSAIPASGQSSYVTMYDEQRSVCFQIFEGERSDSRKNRFLGLVTISDITPAPPGQCKVTLTLNVDDNGILTATAKEKHRSNVKELKINYIKGDKSEGEIKNSLLDAEINRKEDERFTEFANLKAYLLNYCISVVYNLDLKKLKGHYGGIYELCKETHQTVNNMEVEDRVQVEDMLNEIKIQCEPAVKYYNFDFMPHLDIVMYLVDLG